MAMSLADVEDGRRTLEVLQEMLTAVKPNSPPTGAEFELISQLAQRCKQLQPQIASTVESTSDEGILRHALSLNDELQSALKRYDSLISSRQITPPAVWAGRFSSASPSPGHGRPPSLPESPSRSPRHSPRVSSNRHQPPLPPSSLSSASGSQGYSEEVDSGRSRLPLKISPTPSTTPASSPSIRLAPPAGWRPRSSGLSPAAAAAAVASPAAAAPTPMPSPAPLLQSENQSESQSQGSNPQQHPPAIPQQQVSDPFAASIAGAEVSANPFAAAAPSGVHATNFAGSATTSEVAAAQAPAAAKQPSWLDILEDSLKPAEGVQQQLALPGPEGWQGSSVVPPPQNLNLPQHPSMSLPHPQAPFSPQPSSIALSNPQYHHQQQPIPFPPQQQQLPFPPQQQQQQQQVAYFALPQQQAAFSPNSFQGLPPTAAREAHSPAPLPQFPALPPTSVPPASAMQSPAVFVPQAATPGPGLPQVHPSATNYPYGLPQNMAMASFPQSASMGMVPQQMPPSAYNSPIASMHRLHQNQPYLPHGEPEMHNYGGGPAPYSAYSNPGSMSGAHLPYVAMQQTGNGVGSQSLQSFTLSAMANGIAPSSGQSSVLDSLNGLQISKPSGGSGGNQGGSGLSAQQLAKNVDPMNMMFSDLVDVKASKASILGSK